MSEQDNNTITGESLKEPISENLVSETDNNNNNNNKEDNNKEDNDKEDNDIKIAIISDDRIISIDLNSSKPSSEPVSETSSENLVQNKKLFDFDCDFKFNIVCDCSKFFSSINQKLNDQDTIQKFNVAITVIIEMYRVMVSSLLVLFVPQNCDGHVCDMNENMVWMDSLYNSGLVVNFITLFGFIIMYFFEVKRENKLITYLEVNKNVACDNDSVGKVLEGLALEKKESILYFDNIYQKLGYFMLLMFAFNTILSGFVVYEYYLDNQTTSTYITNILFMITKLGEIYSTVNTERNVFYSAYMKGKVQFNDVDPNKRLLIENVKEPFLEKVEEDSKA